MAQLFIRLLVLMAFFGLPTIFAEKETYQGVNDFYGDYNSAYDQQAAAFDNNGFGTRQAVVQDDFTPTDGVTAALIAVSHPFECGA